MNASQALIGHFATSPESLQKVRSEFGTIYRTSEEYDPEDSKLSKFDFLQKYVSLKNTQEATYLGQVMCEVLRFMSILPIGTVSTLERDTTIGKYHIKAGDVV